MNKWNVTILSKVYKQLKKLPTAIQDLADEAVECLEQEGVQPRGWDVKKTGEHEYRIRLNYRYRMRYVVKDKELFIEVFYIGHRKEAYR
jgi:mRNA interferase RelE/StbE